MQTLFIFVIVLVLPNGEVAVQSKKTNQCPNQEEFANYMLKNVNDGLVYDWSATCIKKEAYFPEEAA